MYQVSLKAARVNRNMRQKDAAKALCVDVATVINWEKGKTAPKSYQLKSLCAIYNVPIDCVFLDNKCSLSEQKQ